MYTAIPHPLSRSPTPVRVSPPTPTLALDLAPPPESVAKKFRDDVWCSNPPSVTSYIACLYPKTTTSHDIETLLKSPICGFGWRFELLRKLRKIRQKSSPNSQVQVWFVGQTTLFFQPHMCSSMPLKNVTITNQGLLPWCDEFPDHNWKSIFRCRYSIFNCMWYRNVPWTTSV